MKTNVTARSRPTLPKMGTSNSSRGQEDETDLDAADQDVGNDLADQHFRGTHRHRQQVFHGAAFPFARDGQAGDQDHCQGEDDAHETGDDVVLRDRFGVVAGVNAQVDRAARASKIGERALEIVLERHLHEHAQRTDGVAGCGRIGRIGLDEQHRPVAAQEVAAEVLRDRHHE